MDTDQPNQERERREVHLTPYQAPEPRIEVKRRLNWRWLLPLLAVLIAFGAGFAPAWRKAAQHASERDAALRSARVLELEALISRACIDARRGEYESARQAASQFFTVLSTEVQTPLKNSAFSSDKIDALRTLLSHRDGLITLLARSDPASAERLTEVYLTYRNTPGAAQISVTNSTTVQATN
jgi:hypothetical protein